MNHSKLRGVLLAAAALLGSTAGGYQQVLDGEDPVLKITAGTNWVLDKTGTFQGNYRFSSVAGTGSSVATWTLDALPPGTYTVEFYVDNGNYAQVVPYAIEHDGGLTTVTASQNFVGAGWKPLGNFNFTHAGRITQTDAWSGAGAMAIADALRLTLQGSPIVPTLNVVAPEITLVVDDLGFLNPASSSTYTYQLYDAVPGATYAVLPSLTYSTQCLQVAATKGIETLLHQPLQYIGQPNSNPSDPTRVYISMTDAQIVSTVQNNLTPMLPYIVGVNNHQGSRFSQYRHGMDVLVGELKTQGFFYFDSRTITDSNGYDAAKAAGMLTGERDLFIDGLTVQDTKNRILSVAERAKYSPNYSYTMIGHQRDQTVPGILQVQSDLQTMGVGLRRLSRTMSMIVETDSQPPGCTVTYSGAWSTTSTDMISQELVNGDARVLLGVAAGTATFRPNLPKPGMFRVFVAFAAGANNSTAARISVAANDGVHVSSLNQSVDGGRWHYIGAYPFAAGTAGSVQLDNSLAPSATRPLRADAVKFVYDGAVPSTVDRWEDY
ncbi:MAG: divergent polysaccharide deacetylase family protein [Candidatus Sumerlaeaceae bacterium]